MENKKFYKEYLSCFYDALKNIECKAGNNNIDIEDWIKLISELLNEAKNNKKNLYMIGNGASCSISDHLCSDFIKNLKIKSFSLSNGSLLTCFTNDYCFENSFLEILKRTFSDGDILFAISSSGKSKNILNAAQYIRDHYKENVITITGFKKNNPLRDIGNFSIHVNSNKYGIVESCHTFFLHSLIDFCINADN